jgi:hypothetical protein
MIDAVFYGIAGVLASMQGLSLLWLRNRSAQSEQDFQAREDFEIDVLRGIDMIPENVGRQIITFGAALDDTIKTLPPLFAASMGEVMEKQHMSSLGKLSGASRQMGAMNSDLAQQAMGQDFPLAAMVSEADPQIAKYMEKYPFLASFVQAAAVKLLGPGILGMKPAPNGGAPPAQQGLPPLPNPLALSPK